MFCRALTISMVLVAGLASAQVSLRNSLAGDAAAEAGRQQLDSQAYTYKAGDFRLLAAPSLEMDWNDNVNSSRTSAQSDFILQPLLQLTASYPLTQRNLLSLNLGVGYEEYLRHGALSRAYISSDSGAAFNLYIKDFAINFHDRFTMTANSQSEAAISGTAVYGTFINTAGLTVTWDLEDIVLTLGYDHQNTLSEFQQFDYTDNSAELPLARVGVHLRPDLTVGIEGTASYTTYTHAVLNDNQSYSIGAYADWNPGTYFHVQPRAGYTIFQFQHTSQSAQVFELTPSGIPIIVPSAPSIQTADTTSWYADLTVSHEVSKVVSYHLSAGHEIRLGIQSDAVEDTYFRPGVTLAVFRNVDLTTSLIYEHGNQGAGNVQGNLKETYDQYGAGVSASCEVMKRLKATLNYQLTVRSSTLAQARYTDNLVGLRLTYQAQ